MKTIKVPAMLMIGSSGREAGKTDFACSLIEKFGSRCDVVGIKVTTIAKAGDVCPRGGTGCGVCSSFQGRYHITEETDSTSDKDTCRMLAAGAKKVFWLRVRDKYLQEAAAALLEVIGDDAISICESNSLRKVVEPGVFVMLQGSGTDRKVSAVNVAQYADMVVSYDGSEFDIEDDEIELSDNRWFSRIKATAIVLAGGASVRMGQDKSMMLIEGQPLIEHLVSQLINKFNQVLISVNDVKKYEFLGCKVVPDELEGHGPLGGIASSLKTSSNEINFIVACDIPRINISFVREMVKQIRDYDVVMPKTGPDKNEPLFAVYKKSALASIENALRSSKNRIVDALRDCKVKYIDLSGDEGGWFCNLNTMQDYNDFIREKKDASLR